ncbi:hypothetical protein LOK49_LG06G03481 [Camellia lanceoleosa]|uniref:Uncharacterized protein n=1 Tax=Camellia lanceoleosa TaxID=1840588 RepID=A0ACC0HK51_9ERIC|nr:hypothetical protein LOK49_LG06G03481 [Camellia lanceoleosa]
MDERVERGDRANEGKSSSSSSQLVPPRVFVKGRYVGGVEEVMRIVEDGCLGELLEGVRRTNSPWTRSCERKRQNTASKTTANELGVTAGRLITKDHEVKILEVDGVNCASSAGNAVEEFSGSVLGVEGNVMGGDGGIYVRNVERGSTSVHVWTPSRNVTRNAGKHVMDVGPHVFHTTEKIAEFELEINEKDGVISELSAEMDRLR